MVLVKIVTEIAKVAIAASSKYGVRGLKGYSRAEGRVFTRLYGHARGRGVRHGLAAGGVIGNLINNGEEPPVNGKVPKFYPSNSKNKARGGQFRYSSQGNRVRYSSNKRRRRNCTCGRGRRSYR